VNSEDAIGAYKPVGEGQIYLLGSLFLGLGAATRVAHVNSFLLSLADTIHDSFLDKQRGEVGGVYLYASPPTSSSMGLLSSRSSFADYRPSRVALIQDSDL
jgi:hypothetical protein